jgi:endo-1,4-beta-xylanase
MTPRATHGLSQGAVVFFAFFGAWGCSSAEGDSGAESTGGSSGAAGAGTNLAGASTAGGSQGGAEAGGATGASGSSATTGGTVGAIAGGAPNGTGALGGATSSGGYAGATVTGGGASGTSNGSGAGTASGGASGTASGGAGGATTQLVKFVGNITTNGAVRDGFAMYWNQITPENEGKWGSVQPSQGTFNWSSLDKIYAYAGANNVVFKQHNFIWGSQQPSWVNASNAQASVQAWMKAFCDRYPNTRLIDVVNEPPPHTTPSYIDGMGGTGTSGYDWIVNAFKWARSACPHAILILNDYNNIEYSGDSSHFLDIVTKLRAAGAPIDALGAQAHDAYKFPASTVKGFVDKLAATGLPVYITEYDIPIADDAQQKAVMQDQMTMYWGHPGIQGITLWGYIVGATWKTNTGLQQTNGTLRPAMTWLMSFLGRP